MGGIALKVIGEVSGRMLAGAMINAQAVTRGDLTAKQLAGTGINKIYLSDNSARLEAWNKATGVEFGRGIPMEAVIARASLNPEWLERAGKIIEAATDIETRRELLGQVITPHLVNISTLFGIPVGGEGRPAEVDAAQLAEILRPKLPALPLELIDIPAGEFMMGSKDYGDEQPIRRISLSAYRLAKYEMINDWFGIFMAQTGHRAPDYWTDSRFGKERPKNPVVGTDWNDEESFLLWLALRHPTEAEWEYAARGPEGRIYPWKGDWDPSKVTFNTDGTRPVDAHPEGASWCGVMDLSGNVWERVADWYANRYNAKDLKDPKGPRSGSFRVLRGGSWLSTDRDHLRGSYRSNFNPDYRGNDVGFRAAEDIK